MDYNTGVLLEALVRLRESLHSDLQILVAVLVIHTLIEAGWWLTTIKDNRRWWDRDGQS